MEKKCNTCFNEDCVTIRCFKNCSYTQCNDCILEWLKLESYRPKYECPQCKYISVYSSIGSMDNYTFSEWCRNDPYIVDNLFKKIFSATVSNVRASIETDYPTTINNNGMNTSNLADELDNIVSGRTETDRFVSELFLTNDNINIGTPPPPTIDLPNMSLSRIFSIGDHAFPWSMSGDIGSYDPDVITQQEISSDLENIRRHLPTMYYRITGSQNNEPVNYI